MVFISSFFCLVFSWQESVVWVSNFSSLLQSFCIFNPRHLFQFLVLAEADLVFLQDSTSGIPSLQFSPLVFVQINGLCLSPTSLKQKKQHAPELKWTKSQGTTRKIRKVQSLASVDEWNGGGADEGFFLSHIFPVLIVFL